MRTLNAEISKDTTLGEDFQIGHSYFLPQEGVDASTPESAKTWLKRVIKYDILPLLREYMGIGLKGMRNPSSPGRAKSPSEAR